MELNIRSEQYIEAMALSAIVVETMLDDSVSCVVYSNEGSSQSVTGSYVVQSLTVKGVQRSLPTFPIFTKTRDTLKELTIATLDILAASCGHRCSTSEIFKKVTFTMVDGTAHNIGVVDLVCNALYLSICMYLSIYTSIAFLNFTSINYVSK